MKQMKSPAAVLIIKITKILYFELSILIIQFLSQMSVVSSRVTSVSSILKGSGVRSALVGPQKKICFKLPRDLKTVLLNYENGCDRQAYQDMICILRDSNVKVSIN